MTPGAAVLAAVASARRREILRLTWTSERTAGDLHRALPDVTWGAVSLQIRQLVEAGLLDRRVDGRHRYYRARRQALGSLAGTLEAMWGDALHRLKVAAELEAARRGPAPRTPAAPHSRRRPPLSRRRSR
jgi:DNA-binding transcriptional ArsR family regulator